MKTLARFLLTTGAAAGSLASQSAPMPAQDAPPPPPIQWKELTRSGLPIQFYGFFDFEVHYNTARMDSVVIPTRVLPETEGTPGATESKRDDNQIHFDPRLTRFGVDLTPVKVNDTTVTGKLEIDFANFPTGASESRATPRIRLAYLDIAEGSVGLRVGQDWDTISPLFPSVNNEMLMWNAGNTGDRRSQIQGRWNASSTTQIKLALGLTGAINNEDLDGGASNSERDGFDSGLPHVQARIGTKPFELVEKKPAEFGLWGLYGRTETDTAFGGEHRFDTWIAGVDVTIPLCAKFTLRGEGWLGENLADVRGGIGQSINTTTGDEIASAGGWAEVGFQAAPKTKFHVGATLDDPDNGDLSTTLASANKRRNQSAYCGTVVDWDSGVRTGLDVTYWETEYMGTFPSNGSTGNAVRVDLWFRMNF